MVLIKYKVIIMSLANFLLLTNNFANGENKGVKKCIKEIAKFFNLPYTRQQNGERGELTMEKCFEKGMYEIKLSPSDEQPNPSWNDSSSSDDDTAIPFFGMKELKKGLKYMEKGINMKPQQPKPSNYESSSSDDESSTPFYGMKGYKKGMRDMHKGLNLMNQQLNTMFGGKQKGKGIDYYKSFYWGWTTGNMKPKLNFCKTIQDEPSTSQPSIVTDEASTSQPPIVTNEASTSQPPTITGENDDDETVQECLKDLEKFPDTNDDALYYMFFKITLEDLANQNNVYGQLYMQHALAFAVLNVKHPDIYCHENPSETSDDNPYSWNNNMFGGPYY